MDKRKQRIIFIAVAIFLILVEFYIGIFVHDDFVRPYVGDVIVVVVLYAIVRAIVPTSKLPISVCIFLFSFAYEFTQIPPLVDIFGIKSGFFRALMGTSFSWIDIVCYLVGCVFCFIWDIIIAKMGD